MHRTNPQPTAIFLASCLLVSSVLTGSGCRNTLPEGQVRLQSRPNTHPDGIEEPPSRLYSAFGFGLGRTQHRQPAIEAQATNNRSRTSNSRDQLSASNIRQVSGNTSNTPGTSFSFSDADTQDSNTQPPLSLEEQEMLMEAFEDASPEIRRLAERRMSSLKAQAANKPASPTPTSPAAPTKQSIEETANQENLPSLHRTAKNPASTEIRPTSAAANANSDAQTVTTSVKQAKADPDSFAMPDLSSPTSTVAASNVEDSIDVSTEDIALAEPAKPIPARESSDTVVASKATADSQAETPQPSNELDLPELLAEASDQQLLQELIHRQDQRLREAIASNQPVLNDVLRLRTYRLFEGGLEQATQPVEGWSTSEQEFLNYQTLALWHLIDPASHPVQERRWAMALPELRQATNHLAAATGNLHVHNLAFCTAVDGYGKLTPFESTRFTAGQQVILYSEVENFVAERLSDGYETHLRGTYRILDSTGRRVAEQVLAEDRQTCNNYRRDYFLPYILHLPDRLSAGNYRFELTLEDVKGKKFGQASIPFEIIAGQ